MSFINEDMLKNTKINSIGIEKKDELIVKKKNVSKKLLISLLSILMSLTLSACSNVNVKQEIIEETEVTSVENYDVNNTDVEFYSVITGDHLKLVLKENNLDCFQPNNTVEEYAKIKHLLYEEDLIFYYDYLGEIEGNKLFQAFGYNNIIDYVKKNNYYDTNGNPSIEIFRNSIYEEVTNKMRENVK